MFAKFSGVESQRTVSNLEKERENFRVVYSIKRAREIRKFHVAVLQRRLTNVQKACKKARAKLLFANTNLLLFCRSRCRQRRRCLSFSLL